MKTEYFHDFRISEGFFFRKETKINKKKIDKLDFSIKI